MPWVTVHERVRIPAPSDRVWMVIVDPAMHPVLDPRVELVSTTGRPESSTGEYVLRVRHAGATQLLHYVVTERQDQQLYAVDITVDGRLRGTQRATLERDSDGTQLGWEVRTMVPTLGRFTARGTMRRELTTWLRAVSTAALSPSGSSPN